jgi:hypothetical protein
MDRVREDLHHRLHQLEDQLTADPSAHAIGFKLAYARL